MLTQKISEIPGVEFLLGNQLLVLCRKIVLYIARICPSIELKRTASGVLNTGDFNEFKSWVDGSDYTLDRLRRAIIYMVRKRSKLTWGSKKMCRITARRFKIEREDCELVCDMMTPRDMRQLKRLRGNLNYKRNPLLDKVLTDGQILKHCRSVAWKKLRFLAKHDHALSGGTGSFMNSFVNDLMSEASRLSLYYADFDNELQLKNYIRRGVTNYALRLIEFHTAHKRARIKQSSTEDREFDIVVTSLTGIEGDDQQVLVGQQLDARLQLEIMLKDDSMAPLVLAVTGKDPKFNLWAENMGIDVSQLTDQELVSYAADYVGANLGVIRDRKEEFLGVF